MSKTVMIKEQPTESYHSNNYVSALAMVTVIKSGFPSLLYIKLTLR